MYIFLMHEIIVENPLPIFPTFTILHPKLWAKFYYFPKPPINEVSDPVEIQDFKRITHRTIVEELRG